MARPKQPTGSGSPPRQRPEWDSKRQQILEAAAEVFFTHGYSAGTTRQVAAKVGLTQPAIYYYVGSKEDLMRELVRQVDSEFNTIMADVDAAGTDSAVRLRALVRSFVDRVTRNQMAFAVYWKEYRSIPRSAAQQVGRDQRTFMKQVSALIQEAQEDGVLPADQPVDLLSGGILGMMSWMYWWYRPGSKHGPEDVADAFCALLGLTDK